MKRQCRSFIASLSELITMDLLQSFSSEKPQYRDCLLVIFTAAAFPVLRYFLDIIFFERLAIWSLKSEGSGSDKSSKDGNGPKIFKFKESLWKLSCYAAWEFFIYRISLMEPWFFDTKVYFQGWPHQSLKLPLKLYYTSKCSCYIYGIVALLVWETRRNDFGVLVSHHLITLLLISYSYITRFFRIGAMTLALHDMSSLIMEVAKLCKYSGKELTASIFFGIFAISWVVLRLVYFPFWVIRSSSYELAKVLDHSNVYHTWMFYSFNTLLITLLIFHIYWWVLICRMASRQLHNNGKIGEDIRSGNNKNAVFAENHKVEISNKEAWLVGTTSRDCFTWIVSSLIHVFCQFLFKASLSVKTLFWGLERCRSTSFRSWILLGILIEKTLSNKLFASKLSSSNQWPKISKSVWI